MHDKYVMIYIPSDYYLQNYGVGMVAYPKSFLVSHYFIFLIWSIRTRHFYF